MGTLREEFRLRKFGFSGVSGERFYISQWRAPGVAYMFYRMAMATYSLVVLVVTANQQLYHHNDKLEVWGAYLTNWTYTLLTFYFVYHALVVICAHLACRNQRLCLCRRMDTVQHVSFFQEFLIGGESRGEEAWEATPLSADVIFFQRPTCLHLNVLWIVFSMASTTSFMVSVVFWSILVPEDTGNGLNELNTDNLQLHLINSVLVLIELAVTAVPVRLLHVIYPIIFTFFYFLFALFYWIQDHSHVMYPILDFGKTSTIGYACLVGFVVHPILQCFVYLLHRLKSLIFTYIYELQ